MNPEDVFPYAILGLIAVLLVVFVVGTVWPAFGSVSAAYEGLRALGVGPR